MSEALLAALTVFVLAILCGFAVISKVRRRSTRP